MKTEPWWTPAAQQRAFRVVLDGFARPGTPVPAGSAGAVLMFLSVVLDESVSLADPSAMLDADVRRLLMAPTAPVERARFVLSDGRKAPADGIAPALGTLESPELGATLVLSVDGFGAAPSAPDSLALRLRGPGVRGQRTLIVSGLHSAWLSRRAVWVAAYPLGVDMVLAAPDALVALPRTTHVEVASRGQVA